MNDSDGSFFIGLFFGLITAIVFGLFIGGVRHNRCEQVYNVHSCEMIYVPNTAVELIEKYKGKYDENNK